ncbi:MAG: hypothetical protein J6D47_12185 [Peptostreptococcaceae bacterium]|nr:hypothetical protein [Peptostreptococcaceae bacterium]
MKNEKVISTINLLGFAFLMYASYLFRTNQSAFNKDLDPLFNPAPYSFGIWIVIYIALIIWIIKGFFAKDKIKEMYLKISLWFVACMILNGVTVLLPTTFSVIMIIGALITSLVIYNIVDKFNIAKRYRIPFSLLSGWLSVATIVNISKFLRNMGVTNILGINQVGWTNTLLVVGCILAILFTIIRNDIVYPLVFIWGYIAIAVQNKDINSIIYTVGGTCVLIIIGIIYGKLRNRHRV